MRSKLILATRGSPLALVQANFVKSEVMARWPGLEVTLLPIKTTGDRILDKPLRSEGGKGLFVKEIEEALKKGEADFAVHSVKDMPSILPEGLKLGVVLKREDPADVLVSEKFLSLAALPKGARVGTASLRRKIQLLKLRPDLSVLDLRGNVETRIKRMREGRFEAVVLALAGLKRLGRERDAREVLPFVAAPGQGALGLEYSASDVELEKLLAVLNDPETETCIKAERIIQKNLEGSCELPLGAHGVLEEGKLRLKAFLSDAEGQLYLEDEVVGDPTLSQDLGEKLSEILLARGGRTILEDVRKKR